MIPVEKCAGWVTSRETLPCSFSQTPSGVMLVKMAPNSELSRPLQKFCQLSVYSTRYLPCRRIFASLW
ncbi:hypothetical protein D3C77_687910 [compost metagenome]